MPLVYFATGPANASRCWVVAFYISQISSLYTTGNAMSCRLVGFTDIWRACGNEQSTFWTPASCDHVGKSRAIKELDESRAPRRAAGFVFWCWCDPKRKPWIYPGGHTSSSEVSGTLSIKMSAISASEKVDGFTRKSMRKAQRQRKSQGSSQYRTQSAPVELSPLPQLKGRLKRMKVSAA